MCVSDCSGVPFHFINVWLVKALLKSFLCKHHLTLAVDQFENTVYSFYSQHSMQQSKLSDLQCFSRVLNL